MSNLTVTTLAGKETSNNTVSIAAGHMLSTQKFYSPGSVVQVVTKRTDTRTTLSSSNSGNGTQITDLLTTITPKFSTSLLIIQCMINFEMDQDDIFLMFKDGALITSSGYTGYNSSIGNIRSSGLAASSYDQNQDSTPQNLFLQYFIPAGSVTTATYAPAIRSSNVNNYTFALNRTIAGSTGDSHESMISTMTIWEIAQ